MANNDEWRCMYANDARTTAAQIVIYTLTVVGGAVLVGGLLFRLIVRLMGG